MTLQILVRDRLSVLIGELERSADGRDLLRDRRREPSGHDKDDAEAEHQPGEKCRAHRKDAGAACGHLNGALCAKPGPNPAAYHGSRMTEHLASRSRLVCEQWGSGTGPRRSARPGRMDVL